MAAISDISDGLNRGTGGSSGTPEPIFWFKNARVAGAAASSPIVGQKISLWEWEGAPSHGAVPAASAVYPDNTTPGGLMQNDPGGGRQKWNTFAQLVSNAIGAQAQAYDRLAQFGGLSATTITAQTVNLTPTRYTNGIGNRIYLEIATLIGATATTFTVSYHNQANAVKTSPATVIGGTGSREAQRLIEVPLASGDTGVISVETITILATTNTAGSFAVIIGHPIDMYCSPAAAVMDSRSYLDNPKEILQDACITFFWTAGATTVTTFNGLLFSIEK